VLTGLTSDATEVSTGAAAAIFGRALAGSVGASMAAAAAGSAARWRAGGSVFGSGSAGGFAVSRGEFASWAAGSGRALAEFGAQLARARLPGSQRRRPALDRLDR
jgi:hypothetical protein